MANNNKRLAWLIAESMRDGIEGVAIPPRAPSCELAAKQSAYSMQS